MKAERFFAIFAHLGFNEADKLKSGSILIYSHLLQSIYTQGECHDAVLIKEMIFNLENEIRKENAES